jgi:hypothetical protein
MDAAADLFVVSSAKNRSIWLSQQADVGVRWTCQCGRLDVEIARHLGVDRAQVLYSRCCHVPVDNNPLRRGVKGQPDLACERQVGASANPSTEPQKIVAARSWALRADPEGLGNP